MKKMILAAMAAVAFSLTGCGRGPSAAQLLQKHPLMQKVCDAGWGGCAFVEIACEVYDGKGNSTLRDTVVWTIKSDNVTGRSFRPSSHPLPLDEAIDEALKDWIDMKKMDDEIKETPKTIYPNSRPCDKNCR